MNIQTTTRPNVATPAQKPQQADIPQQPVADPTPQKDYFASSVELLKDSGIFVFNEGREAMRNDPALGLRLAANQFDNSFLQGTGDVANGFSSMAVPFIRAGLLGANIYRANRTFHQPGADLLHKGMDVGRVLTDVVGLAGAVISVAMPSMASTGRVMTQFAYGADLLSHSVRSLEYAGDRIAFLKEARAKEKAAKKDA